MWLAEKKTRFKLLWLGIVTMLLVSSFSLGCAPSNELIPIRLPDKTELMLPEPRFDGDISLEQTLLKRRSVRDYAVAPVTLNEVAQLLWAAQGITDPRGLRTAPSAGATYPLEVYLVAGNVAEVIPGVYRYDPPKHKLVRTLDGDVRVDLSAAALGQSWVKEGAVNIIFTAVYERTTRIYGDRGIKYVHMEVGHAAQNVCLQAVALGLGVVVVGAFYDDRVSEVLNLPTNEKPLYIIPVGRIK